MSAAAQIQEAEPIVVWVSRDRLGATFVLHPWTERYLEREFPGLKRWPQVSIRRAATQDFEQLSESLQAHVVALLTGLDLQQLTALCEVRFMHPVTNETLTLWPRAHR